MQEPRFKKGDRVCRPAAPELSGTIVSSAWSDRLSSYSYTVQFGKRRSMVEENGLAPFFDSASAWEQLALGQSSGATQFRAALTHHRLRRPPSRIANSFASARAQFFPYQFKPLLKFLDRPERRILVADDVGLGKTIEAGYILRELRAREPGALSRVLVLVPARLTSKWKSELENRFEEHFEIVRRAQVHAALERLERGQELEPYRWIASYESLRDRGILELLERTNLNLNLLIADEAHRMRNTTALQHQLGMTLTEMAEAAVFLSATPIQNGTEDLFNLLRMLVPDEFGDRSFFDDQIAANGPINRALRALMAKEPDWADARAHLEEFFRSNAGSALAPEQRAVIFDGLERRPTLRRALVELQADISRLSPTSHVITRTRKFEVMSQRAIRFPKWHAVELTPAEQAIYDSVRELCTLARGSQASQFALLMAYRMTASCIPAAMNYFAEQLREVGSDLGEEIEEVEEKDDKPSEPTKTSHLPPEAQKKLRENVRVWGEASHDSKLETFVQALEEGWADDLKLGVPRRKVVVFSFFRRTLDYLHRMLGYRRIGCRVMHGRHPVAERERSLDEFKNDPSVEVLLTSDVGGEGIDLQHASMLVNYDLPWNPMVVEQRIGRIDRIGQKSERISIVNLVAKGSIEERILQRLLERIQVFRESIGELDEIIGDEIEKLTADALSGKIPENEIDEVVRAREDAVERNIAGAREMRTRVDGLLAADQALLDEIEAVTGERQIPTSHELLEFINGALAKSAAGVQLPREIVDEVVTVNLRGPLGAAIENWGLSSGENAHAFGRRVSTNPVPLTLSRDKATVYREAELIHLNHPLVRYCIHLREQELRTNVPYSVRLTSSEVLPPGEYAFSIHFLDTRSTRARTDIQAFFADLHSARIWGDAEQTRQVVLEMLDRGEEQVPPPHSTDVLTSAEARLNNALMEVRDDLYQLEKHLAEQRAALLTANQRAQAEHRVRRARNRLDQHRQKNAPAFTIRMDEARLRKAEEAAAIVRAASPDAVPPVSVEPEEIAVGVLTVGVA